MQGREPSLHGAPAGAGEHLLDAPAGALLRDAAPAPPVASRLPGSPCWSVGLGRRV
jgi:hypothetical protein